MHLCCPHLCQHCDITVDRLGLHGLSCKKSEGHHYRHSSINDLLHRALSSTQVSSRLEPSGLTRSDGKHPDGVTMVPWKNGKPFLWDTSCPDTLVLSYCLHATSSAGAVAGMAEEKKICKYSCLAPTHTIMRDTGRMLLALARCFRKLAARMRQQSGERRGEGSPMYLMQRLSVAVQRGDAVTVGGTVGGPPSIRRLFVVFFFVSLSLSLSPSLSL